MTPVVISSILSLLCPSCGKNIKKPIDWFKAQEHSCPHCGVSLAENDLKEAIESAQTKLTELNVKIKQARDGS